MFTVIENSTSAIKHVAIEAEQVQPLVIGGNDARARGARLQVSLEEFHSVLGQERFLAQMDAVKNRITRALVSEALSLHAFREEYEEQWPQEAFHCMLQEMRRRRIDRTEIQNLVRPSCRGLGIAVDAPRAELYLEMLGDREEALDALIVLIEFALECPLEHQMRNRAKSLLDAASRLVVGSET